MTPDRDAETAVQYLTWALEEIENLGKPKAALYVRIALSELLREQAGLPDHFSDEAKRFRDKADEAEQFAVTAQTSERRNALRSIVQTYRRTADQMDRLAGGAGTRSDKWRPALPKQR